MRIICINAVSQSPRAIKQHLLGIFDELMRHDGYGEFKVEMRILKRGQKEVLLHYGKQYRYVVDFDPAAAREHSGREEQGV